MVVVCIVSVCVCVHRNSTAAIVSVDTTGLVNLGTFTKFIRWSVDTQCLLDGSAGQVVAVAVLLPEPKPTPPPPAVAAGIRAVEAVGTLLALSTARSSFIVALHPEPRVLYKWDRPSGACGSLLPPYDVWFSSPDNPPSPTSPACVTLTYSTHGFFRLFLFGLFCVPCRCIGACASDTGVGTCQSAQQF